VNGDVLPLHSSIERIALPVIFLVLVSILVLGWSIHYPEVIAARAEFVDSTGDGVYDVSIDLPQNNIPGFRTNMPAQFCFDDFPIAGYGSVNGTIRYAFDRRSSAEVLCKVRLPEGLVSNRRASIPYKEGMKADVLIIAADMRLLQHIFYNRSKRMAQ
jgi:hypothetical protein